MDIQTIFDRYSVNHIHEQTGISRVTLRSLRDNKTTTVQHRTIRALAAWLNEPVELLHSAVRQHQTRKAQEPRA
tara:strand:- start:804 stop:1025 length:222 start_codon:yes stop_codon:yes gene_type:complete